MGKKKKKGGIPPKRSVGIVTGFLGADTLVNGFLGPGLDNFERGDYKGGLRDISDRWHNLITPNTNQFERFTKPLVGAVIISKVATHFRLNPGMTFGKGRNKTRLRAI